MTMTTTTTTTMIPGLFRENNFTHSFNPMAPVTRSKSEVVGQDSRKKSSSSSRTGSQASKAPTGRKSVPRAAAHAKAPSTKFPYHLLFLRLDLRVHPELYRQGVGEQGVLQVQPYKSKLLPLWAFRTPEIAKQSARKLEERFEMYRDQGDFVGCEPDFLLNFLCFLREKKAESVLFVPLHRRYGPQIHTNGPHALSAIRESRRRSQVYRVQLIKQAH